MKSLLAVLLLAGCGAPDGCCDAPTPAPQPAEVVPYVDDFARGLGRAVTTPVQFVTDADVQLPPKVAGRCHVRDGKPVVWVRSEWWPAAPESEHWALLFHELGHCELGRQHSADLDGTCPASLMYESVSPTARCVDAGLRTRDDYTTELFRRT